MVANNTLTRSWEGDISDIQHIQNMKLVWDCLLSGEIDRKSFEKKLMSLIHNLMNSLVWSVEYRTNLSLIDNKGDFNKYVNALYLNETYTWNDDQDLKKITQDNLDCVTKEVLWEDECKITVMNYQRELDENNQKGEKYDNIFHISSYWISTEINLDFIQDCSKVKLSLINWGLELFSIMHDFQNFDTENMRQLIIIANLINLFSRQIQNSPKTQDDNNEYIVSKRLSWKYDLYFMGDNFVLLSHEQLNLIVSWLLENITLSKRIKQVKNLLSCILGIESSESDVWENNSQNILNMMQTVANYLNKKIS